MTNDPSVRSCIAFRIHKGQSYCFQPPRLTYLSSSICVYNKYVCTGKVCTMYYLDSKHSVCQNMNDEILYCSFKIHPCATYLFDM